MNDLGAIFTTPPTLVTWVLIYIVAQRLGELVYANRNTRRLLSEGGEEFGADHYHWFIFLHSAWLAIIFLLVDPLRELNPALLALFIGTQVLRVWTLASIGRWWTTRIISAPHFDKVKRGPYKYVSHPNYLVVVLEIAIVPLLMGLPWVALLFSILNAILLRHRIRVENTVLGQRGQSEA
ncbi:isoprenylcysteine carboxylmethyltransferase family protein [Parasphingorhabdus litoris]|uniref:Isoprenylcysteine carboxylmethyltransferase family protein n=1 Tax=Parasphingorhabdus litoris TaxID=394733 RepID=A0ABN1A515_9SPHN|nr:isoprenylcysteine carboxylmethyltransferase family protein [Parasphingorhabdus litoris]